MPLSRWTEFVSNIHFIIPTTITFMRHHSHTTSEVVKTPYSPVSQILDTFLLVHTKNKDHGLQRELLITGFVFSSATADPQLISCNISSQRQEYPHSLFTANTKKECSTLKWTHSQTTWLKSLFQVSISPIDRHIFDSGQDKPVIPHYFRGGILDRSLNPRFNLPDA